MPKFNKFLQSLSKKINLDLSDPKYKDLLANETLDVPDEVAEALEKGLMSEDAAKNNTKLRSSIRAEVYNGLDSDMESLLEELGLSEDAATPIKEQKKTIDKIKLLTTHYKAEADKATKSGNKADADAYKKQVEDLNNQIKNIKTDSQKTIDQLKTDNENNLTDYSLKSDLGTRQYTLPDAMNAGEKVNMVHSIVSAELKAKGLKLVRENGGLKLQKEDGTDPYDDKNNKLSVTSFLDGALAQRGLLKQTDTTKTGGANASSTPTVQAAPQSVSLSAQNGMAAIDKLIADLPKES